MAAAHPMPSQMPNSCFHLGRYSIHYRLASGGMANLYTASLMSADGFERTVAVKILHAHLCEDPEFVKMFIDEARLVSRISHANVVQILELGRVGRHLYIVMEYIDGESVLALLKRTRPSFAHCARIVANAAAGLHAAHELKDRHGRLLDVIHRDVSPDNLLITYDGEVKVVDFGVARARCNLHKTVSGSIKGKFSYMAPEQASAGSLDRRVDVFSLGVVLYEMTTYRRLFKRESDTDTLAAVLSCRIEPPSKLVEGYPARLERVVLTALQRDPTRRYPTARAMQRDLEHFLLDSGDPVLPSSTRDMMQEVFSDRIALKIQLAAKFRLGSSSFVPDLLSQEQTTRVSTGQIRPGSHAIPMWQQWMLALTSIATVAALLFLIYALATGPRSISQGPVDHAASAQIDQPLQPDLPLHSLISEDSP